MFLQVRFGTQAIGAVGWDMDDTWYMDPQLLVSGPSRYRDAVISKFPSSLEEVRNPTGTIWETRERSKTPKASEQSMFKGEGVCGQCGLDCIEIGFFFFKKKKSLSTNGEGFFLLGQSAPRFLDPTSRQPCACRGKALALSLQMKSLDRWRTEPCEHLDRTHQAEL